MKDLSIPEIAEILDYAHRLKFEEAPDYDWILSMFDKMALRTSRFGFQNFQKNNFLSIYIKYKLNLNLKIRISVYQPNIFDWSANYDQYLELHKVKPEN